MPRRKYRTRQIGPIRLTQDVFDCTVGYCDARKIEAEKLIENLLKEFFSHEENKPINALWILRNLAGPENLQ